MATPSFTGLLVRFPSGVPVAQARAALAAVGAMGSGIELEPLFDTGPAATGLGIQSGAQRTWYLARREAGLAADARGAWEAAYDLANQGSALAAAGGGPAFVEPDLRQDWPHARKSDTQVMGVRGNQQFDDQDTQNFPGGPGFAWHLGDAHSQLGSARRRANASGNAGLIRIAHLDTGYDPAHATFPKDRIDATLQRNFIDADHPNDASDRHVTGMMKNPGHGTGTLSILAGARFSFDDGRGGKFDDALGGAPDARVVPVRVGNSVVQVNTSSIAQGIGYAVQLCRDGQSPVHVISMSMGGVASAAWADAVNDAYEMGIVFVAAAGNNYGALPSRFTVYPARFGRVIAACGIMANSRPYFDLPRKLMQGNWGPEEKMKTALAAFTPNIPWAEMDAPSVVDMDGQGTSAATPQVAAAAALYYQAHAKALFDPARYPQPWMRAQAVRQALFGSVRKISESAIAEKIGVGVLQAAAALDIPPIPVQGLSRMPLDSASFAFLRVLTGLGVSESPLDRMLELEATQLAQIGLGADAPNPFEAAVRDPDRDAREVPVDEICKYLEALGDHPDASAQLKRRALDARGQLCSRTVVGIPDTGSKKPAAKDNAASKAPVKAASPAVAPFSPPAPPFRTLRGYAIDPSLAGALDTAAVSQVLFKVPWETLQPGPVGEYLEVIDIDPASGHAYEPMDLDHPRLLAQDGLPPGEGTPQFHQQMVYAVCSLTIANFERALGRRSLWRPGPSTNPANPKDDGNYVRRLRVHPHALREPNAYYSPQKIALLFGYFNASEKGAVGQLPGGRIFTCLSHDIVAHETTHALLDGMHRRFLLASNPDVRAFHEAFADIVALFQHFTLPEILRHQIAATRGAIRTQRNLLGELASQFGQARGSRGALRDAIGKVDETSGRWTPYQPKPSDYESASEAHDRGAVLVAATFDAFMSIYERRVADLLRLATQGTGVLQRGAIHPDLVNRLASEAAKSANHVLTICIRALDYCPPTDITFGEFLRAIITADYDVVRDDDLGYRVAFIEAFRRRGIYPRDLRTLSTESLLWHSPATDEHQASDSLIKILTQVQQTAAQFLYIDSREGIFEQQRAMRKALHKALNDGFTRTHKLTSDDAKFLGIDPRRGFEVHMARIALRSRPDGGTVPQLLMSLLQEQTIPASGGAGPMQFEGGATVVVDLREGIICYCIRKSIDSENRRERQQAFAMSAGSLRATYLGASITEDQDEPFAALHRGV